MADSYQTRAQLVTDFADNTSGAITAQLLRDLLYSTIILNSSGVVDANGVSTFKLPASTSLDLNGNALLGAANVSLDSGNITSDGSGNLTAVDFLGAFTGNVIPPVVANRHPTATDDGANTGGIGVNIKAGMFWLYNGPFTHPVGSWRPNLLYFCTDATTNAARWALLNALDFVPSFSDSAPGDATVGAGVSVNVANVAVPNNTQSTGLNMNVAGAAGNVWQTQDAVWGAVPTGSTSWSDGDTWDSFDSATDSGGKVTKGSTSCRGDGQGIATCGSTNSRGGSNGEVICSTDSEAVADSVVIGNGSYAAGQASAAYADTSCALLGGVVGQQVAGGSDGAKLYVAGNQTALFTSGDNVTAVVNGESAVQDTSLGVGLKTTRTTLTGSPSYNTTAVNAGSGGIYNSGSKVVTGISTTGVYPGAAVTSNKSGISGGQVVQSVDSSSQITMNANATVSQTGATITCTNNVTTVAHSPAVPSDIAAGAGVGGTPGSNYNLILNTHYANSAAIGPNVVNLTKNAIQLGLVDATKLTIDANGARALNLQVYAAGTAYTVTNASAAVVFGTTSPTLTLATAGKYALRGSFQVDLSGATFAATRTLTVKIRRTNNTAADIANTTRTLVVPITTTLSQTLGVYELPEVLYTATAGDVISLFAGLDTAPSAGALNIVAANLNATNVY